ncbi:hypothetical protein [Paenibacillus ihuae]|uniref:hypothetical protein n=1 Tax=Paenibacillus ihuae TaxID=1232431 RepID=UPI0006D55FE7|nr:hypothetical protein [Paenibacillus ihuae]
MNDNAGRLVEGDELEIFKAFSLSERLKWIREELNKIYVGEYSVKKVASNSRSISHMGLYNLESNKDGAPRPSTLQALSEFYQVPLSVFSAYNPEAFFLGKQVDSDQYKYSDLRSPHYEVEINFIMRSINGVRTVKENILLNVRQLDGEELLSRIKQEAEFIQRRLSRQRQLDDAYDLLKKQGGTDD